MNVNYLPPDEFWRDMLRYNKDLEQVVSEAVRLRPRRWFSSAGEHETQVFWKICTELTDLDAERAADMLEQESALNKVSYNSETPIDEQITSRRVSIENKKEQVYQQVYQKIRQKLDVLARLIITQDFGSGLTLQRDIQDINKAFSVPETFQILQLISVRSLRKNHDRAGLDVIAEVSVMDGNIRRKVLKVFQLYFNSDIDVFSVVKSILDSNRTMLALPDDLLLKYVQLLAKIPARTERGAFGKFKTRDPRGDFMDWVNFRLVVSARDLEISYLIFVNVLAIVPKEAFWKNKYSGWFSDPERRKENEGYLKSFIFSCYASGIIKTYSDFEGYWTKKNGKYAQYTNSILPYKSKKGIYFMYKNDSKTLYTIVYVTTFGNYICAFSTSDHERISQGEGKKFLAQDAELTPWFDVDESYKTVEGLSSKGFAVAHVCDAYFGGVVNSSLENKEAYFEKLDIFKNISICITKQGEFDLSCSSVHPQYPSNIIVDVKLKHDIIPGSVGVILKSGYIVAAARHDMNSVVEPSGKFRFSSNISYLHHDPVIAPVRAVVESTDVRDHMDGGRYNELIVRNWKVGFIFHTEHLLEQRADESSDVARNTARVGASEEDRLIMLEKIHELGTRFGIPVVLLDTRAKRTYQYDWATYKQKYFRQYI